MASSTPSRAKKRSPRAARRKVSPAKRSAPASPAKRAAKPRTSASRTPARRSSPTGEIAPAIRQEWQKLTQRWKNLLPKLAGGKSSAPASRKKKSAARA